MYKLTIVTLSSLIFSTANHAACNKSITRTAPDSRYELFNNNTEVKDKQTGLIWQRCSLGQVWSGTSCTGNAGLYKLKNALQITKNMGGGWRLPNIKELDSLIEQACYSPSINDVFFPNTLFPSEHPTYNQYLSSSPVAYNTFYVWVVSFAEGSVGTHYRSDVNRVRSVRSGQ